MGRWIGIDHGARRIGLAVGDTKARIATLAKVIPARPLQAAIEQIKSLIGEYRAEGLVVGLPINMDDTEGPQAKAVREFAVALETATGLEVRLWDERLSSFEADRKLAGHLTRKKRRARQDAVAAAEILQGFLDSSGARAAGSRDEGEDAK
ncbi:MAG: Holliday junction resolvase RuvX [Phycisphaerae bacterium]